MILSASSIIGDKVKNPAGEDLGKIEELMIDTKDGDVNYAVVSFGGFLGMGDKYFAVPLDAMEVSTGDDSMILNVSKEKLKDAPGFDKDNWPSTADTSWYGHVRSFYTH